MNTLTQDELKRAIDEVVLHNLKRVEIWTSHHFEDGKITIIDTNILNMNTFERNTQYVWWMSIKDYRVVQEMCKKNEIPVFKPGGIRVVGKY